MDIFLFGDSITWGAWDLEGGWASRLKKSVEKTILESNFEYYHAVHLLGVSGDTTRNLLGRMEDEIRARSDERESLTIVALGVNDSAYLHTIDQNVVPIEEFQENLSSIKRIVDAFGTKLIFLGLTPVDYRVDPMSWWPEASYKLEEIERYNTALSQYSLDNKVGFIDLLSKLGVLNISDLLEDGVHPNSKGHELIFEIVRDELTNYL